jgi:hypothetical protein
MYRTRPSRRTRIAVRAGNLDRNQDARLEHEVEAGVAVGVPVLIMEVDMAAARVSERERKA